MTRANFREADFFAANLIGAHLRSADLRGANFDQANLSRAVLKGSNLQRAYLHDCDLTDTDLNDTELGPYSIYNITGIPHWPRIPVAEHFALLLEASAPTTPPDRLYEMAWHWPGVMVQEQIAANPNTPTMTLSRLASQYPAAFLRNPVLLLLFLTDPYWLPPDDAQKLLNALIAHPIDLTPEDASILRLIEHCALRSR